MRRENILRKFADAAMNGKNRAMLKITHALLVTTDGENPSLKRPTETAINAIREYNKCTVANEMKFPSRACLGVTAKAVCFFVKTANKACS